MRKISDKSLHVLLDPFLPGKLVHKTCNMQAKHEQINVFRPISEQNFIVITTIQSTLTMK
jgi:hypothetical protein